LTANGKVDRRSLPLPRAAPDEGISPPVSASTPLQQQILAVWKEVFTRDAIGLDDNFFELGGHSLLATRVVARLNRALHRNVSIAALFRAPTIRTLAEQISRLSPEPSSTPIQRRARQGDL